MTQPSMLKLVQPFKKVGYSLKLSKHVETENALVNRVLTLNASIVSPSSIEAPLFQNASCDPFTPEAKPCTLGNYINYAIDVINAADISAGLAFAKKTNIRVVIKNTGHEYAMPNFLY